MRNSDEGHASPLFVTSVQKAVRVLRCFSGADFGLSLRDISERAKIDKSTAQRFSHTLETLGYLKKDPSTRRYHLTALSLDSAFNYLHSHPVVRKATPFLIECQARCEETVNLTERDDCDIVYLARFPSRNVITAEVFLGMRLPAYCTAPGRAMLAFEPEPEIAKVLSRSKLDKYTAFTINEPASILNELERVREQGYAIVAQESYLGDLSIAAPVLGPGGRAVAAVNIAAPLSRWPLKLVRSKLGPMVTETARAIANTN